MQRRRAGTGVPRGGLCAGRIGGLRVRGSRGVRLLRAACPFAALAAGGPGGRRRLRPPQPKRRRFGSDRCRRRSALTARAMPQAIPTAWQRRLQARGEERHGVAAVAGHRCRARRLVFVAGLVVLAAAHFVMQVRRRSVDRHELVDGAERGPKPRQPVIGKTAIEELRSAHRAHGAGGCAEHHRDQPPSIARRGGDQIVAGGADEAGLKSVGAGIAADQPVEVLRDAPAVADRGDMNEIFVFGQVLDEGAREDRKVAREVIWPSAGRPFGLT